VPCKTKAKGYKELKSLRVGVEDSVKEKSKD
jgi:hypothetical protein